MGETILYWLSKLLVGLFFVGLVGSALVVVITFIEDGQLLLEGKEEKTRTETAAATPKTREAF